MTKPLGFMACLCLLSLQASGLHAHADGHDYIGAPATAYADDHLRDHDHSHDHGHGDGAPNDHDEAHDVSLLDLALGAFKMPLALLALVVVFAVIERTGPSVGLEVVFRILSGRHTRWRPPLRAPPAGA